MSEQQIQDIRAAIREAEKAAKMSDATSAAEWMKMAGELKAEAELSF